MKTLMTCLVALALLAPVATRAPATTVLATSFPTLVQEADLVVVGTAQAIQQEWDEATETPYTLVTFTDLDLLKGRHRHPALTIRLLGGASPDGTSLQIAGVPSFALGERSILFVTGHGHYAIPFVGLWQGVFRVVRDPGSETETVYTHDMRPLTSLPAGAGELVHDGQSVQTLRQAAASPVTLEAFAAAVAKEAAHD